MALVCFVSRSNNQTISLFTCRNLGRQATISTGQADLNMLMVIVVQIGIVVLYGLGVGMFGYRFKFVIFLDVQLSAQN